MIKHRWMDLAKSFGNQIDSDKTVQLKKTKKDIETNVTRIFKLIKSEDLEKKDGNQKHSKNDMELVGLIENFYQQYQSLYALYDHLIGESGRIVRRRKGTTGTSPSSPSSPSSYVSDSEYFSSDELDNNNIKPEINGSQKTADSSIHDLKTENLGLKLITLSRSSSEEVKDAINTNKFDMDGNQFIALQ